MGWAGAVLGWEAGSKYTEAVAPPEGGHCQEREAIFPLSHFCELIQEPFLPTKTPPLLSLRRLCLGKAKTTSVPTAHSPGIWEEGEEQQTAVRAKEEKNFPFQLLVPWVSAHEFRSSGCSPFLSPAQG